MARCLAIFIPQIYHNTQSNVPTQTINGTHVQSCLSWQVTFVLQHQV